jgi:hypothetical protein
MTPHTWRRPCATILDDEITLTDRAKAHDLLVTELAHDRDFDKRMRHQRNACRDIHMEGNRLSAIAGRIRWNVCPGWLQIAHALEVYGTGMRSRVGAARADELRTAGARASLAELAELGET